jgi:hypothetical protein
LGDPDKAHSGSPTAVQARYAGKWPGLEMPGRKTGFNKPLKLNKDGDFA